MRAELGVEASHQVYYTLRTLFGMCLFTCVCSPGCVNTYPRRDASTGHMAMRIVLAHVMLQ